MFLIISISESTDIMSVPFDCLCCVSGISCACVLDEKEVDVGLGRVLDIAPLVTVEDGPEFGLSSDLILTGACRACILGRVTGLPKPRFDND